jgi:ABC-type transport system involved in Fe-S cluster assembly fused permease/ATPase subunit
MFLDLLIAFVYVYTLFDVYMTIILLVVGVSYAYIGAKTTAWSIKRRRRFNNAWRNESKIQNEAINNWQTVSHFNRAAYETDKYAKSLDEFNAAEWRYYISYYVGGSLQSVVMLLGRLAAFSLAVVRVAQGRAPVGNFVTLTIYWRSIESPLAQVSWSIKRLSAMLTDSERLLQLLMTKPTVTSAPNAPDIAITKGEVEFDHVDFAYDPRKQTLKEVSFTAKPGTTVALVGETGGGKSTIIKLLYRYYDVSGGSIRIDGQNIKEVSLDSLRDSFGMVPQDPALFNVTLMENIKYARLDATEEEVKEACRAAAIHDKIETFPDKYKSTVGERGVKLSGGELQRVAVARAILRQPKIVLLDEATSMIDAETEELIQSALKELMKGRTTFVIAHRLSTIQHADQILVINDGQIVEHGTHEELFRLGGKYVALWSKQLSKDVEGVDKALKIAKEDEELIELGNADSANTDD